VAATDELDVSMDCRASSTAPRFAALASCWQYNCTHIHISIMKQNNGNKFPGHQCEQTHQTWYLTDGRSHISCNLCTGLTVDSSQLTFVVSW